MSPAVCDALGEPVHRQEAKKELAVVGGTQSPCYLSGALSTSRSQGRSKFSSCEVDSAEFDVSPVRNDPKYPWGKFSADLVISEWGRAGRGCPWQGISMPRFWFHRLAISTLLWAMSTIIGD